MRRVFLLAVLPLLALTSACSQASAAEPDKSGRVKILVAARDLPAGSTVTLDDIEERLAHESLVTSSVVKPDSASYIVNQKLTLPLLAGDPVHWSFFETSFHKALESCAKFEGEDTSAEQQVARARQIVLSHSR
jgi:Flp pilus assembly protein CpaB